MKTILFILFVFFSINLHAQFQEHIIESDPYYASSIISADIDNDGDNDIIVTGGLNNQLKWVENTDGLGNFNIEHPIMFQPYSYAGQIVTTDIDGDNNIDIIIETGEQDCGEIRTFRNTNGQGNFELFSISMTSCGNRGSIRVGDIDGDNHMDWASSVSSSEYNAPKVSWFKNDGSGNVTEHIIDESFVRSFQLVDLDNDDYIDLVGFNIDQYYNPEIVWYKNIDGTGNFVKQSIAFNSYLNYYSSFIVSDLDSDGDLDIITGSDGQISWYKNDGQQNFSDETYIYINNTTINDWLEIVAVDLDSDGDMDIISTGNDHTIRYYINDGEQNFNPEIVVDNIYRPYNPIYTIDVNGDNRIDIISNSSENGKIAWYENTWELSLEENSISSFSVYPNPTREKIHIKSNMEISQIEIFNQLGVLVLSAIKNSTIDVSSLSSGIYFLEISNNTEAIVKKIVIE